LHPEKTRLIRFGHHAVKPPRCYPSSPERCRIDACVRHDVGDHAQAFPPKRPGRPDFFENNPMQSRFDTLTIIPPV
jgi:hypothetical protein